MANTEKCLYLIDGSGFIFRAYYGIRAPMTATDGTPTNAAYGFTRLLMNLIRDRDPRNIAVVFDPPGPTFRNDIFPEYKANRSEPPDDLKPQFSLCRQAVVAFGIPAVEKSGFEADDVIGTLANRWVADDAERTCVIVTADKDMMQLVSDRVTMWDGKEKETDIAGVHAKFGVGPETVAALLGLAGDSSDNIPGVPGIGPKTAATLLQTYGDMDALLGAADNIKGKRGENLRDFAEQARLSEVLATIKTDVPIEVEDTALKRGEPDPDKLGDFLRALNFKRMIAEFGLEDRAITKTQVDRKRYKTILNGDALRAATQQIRNAGILAFDLETTSLSTLDADIVGIAMAWAPNEAVYVPVGHSCPETQLSLQEVSDIIGPLLTDQDLPKIAQNIKYEIKVLERTLGLQINGVETDTMIAAYLLDPGRRQFGLDELSMDHLGHKMITFAEVTGEKSPGDGAFVAVPLDAATEYAAEDADITLRLAQDLMPKIVKGGLESLLSSVEIPLINVIAKMETAGILVDGAMLKQQSSEFSVRLAHLTESIHDLAEGPFNIDSPKQLAEILFERLGLPAEKKTKTGYSTDQTVLGNLAALHPLPEKVLEYRHLTKLKNTYLDTLPQMIHPKTGRLHTSFHQAVAATGRLSSSEPNLQNIPIRTAEGRAIRQAFVAPAGHKLISADYSQIELRLLAHYSEDPGLIGSFQDKADIHRRTAAQVFGVDEAAVTSEQRRQAKAVNFGLMYGMSAFRLSNELKIPQKVARGIIRKYFAQYSGVRAYFEKAVDDARISQKATTILGRTRTLGHINSQSFNLKQQSERLAINTPIQGSAADMLKLAMIRLDKALTERSLRTRMLLTVHDELVLEVPDEEVEMAAPLIQETMESVLDLRVPLVVELGIGENWAEIH
ncbi:MAG: DNA polymerase I [Myxococcota bacterium]|nr:DNA polymerase I [Myxococcota bacterium]